MFDEFSILFALLGCVAATYFDLRTGKVPNRLTALLLISSAVLSYARYLSEPSYILTYASGFFLGFGIGFVFWKIKAWSGGDAKMFWAISALIPQSFFALNVLFNLAIILGIRFLVLGAMKKKHVILMPYMTAALIASFYLDYIRIIFP